MAKVLWTQYMVQVVEWQKRLNNTYTGQAACRIAFSCVVDSLC